MGGRIVDFGARAAKCSLAAILRTPATGIVQYLNNTPRDRRVRGPFSAYSWARLTKNMVVLHEIVDLRISGFKIFSRGFNCKISLS
jgi:hypothetical protein